MDNKYDIYICYSRKDDDVATDICHFLDQQGLSYWIDRRNIESGEAYAQPIVNAIKGSELFLYIISEGSRKSKSCENELYFAVHLKKRILPLRIDQTPSPVVIGSIQWADYSDKYRWQSALLQLFPGSTEKDNSVTQKEAPKQPICENKPTLWSSVRIGKEEKDALLKICCNRLCDVYIDGEYICEAGNKAIINVPIEYGSYILCFEDKEDTDSYKTIS